MALHPADLTEPGDEDPDAKYDPPLTDVLRELLPDNAHFEMDMRLGLGRRAVMWTTPAGVWTIIGPHMLTGFVGVSGPGGEWRFQGPGSAQERDRQVVALLRAVGAVPPLPDPDRPHGVPLAEVCAALLIPLTGHTDTTRALPEAVERPPGDDRPERVCVSCGESWPCTSARIRDLYLSGDHERLVAVARDLTRLAGTSAESPTP